MNPTLQSALNIQAGRGTTRMPVTYPPSYSPAAATAGAGLPKWALLAGGAALLAGTILIVKKRKR